jgi:hypothetical protein
MRFILKLVALSFICLQIAFAQSSDQVQIKQLMKHQFDKPHAPLSVDPIAVIALCGGDGLTQVNVLEKTGMSKQVATQLSKELLESESKLSPKHKKMLSMFKGEAKVDHHQH